MTDRSTAAVLTSVRSVLLDFDGPVCSIFDGLPAPTVAAELRKLLATRFGLSSPARPRMDDPLEVLRYAGSFSRTAADAIEQALQDAEVSAAGSAQPTAGAREFLSACRTTSRPVVVVSNNSAAAVSAYLTRMGLTSMVAGIVGRIPAEPEFMKPHPELLNRAIAHLRADPARCAMVGDSVTDIQAGQSAKALTIGYANKPGKHATMVDAGADAVTGSMLALARVTSETPSR